MSGQDTRTLNPRQQKFVNYVSSSPSATRAAILAGYAERSAGNQAHRLMQNAEVLRRLAELRRTERIQYRVSLDEQADKYEALFHLSVEQNRLGTALQAANQQTKLYGLYEFGKLEARMSAKDMERLADSVADSLRARAVTLMVRERDEAEYQREQADKERIMERAARIAVAEEKRERIWNFKETMDPAAFTPTQDELERAAELAPSPPKALGARKNDETAAAGGEPLPPIPEWEPGKMMKADDAGAAVADAAADAASEAGRAAPEMMKPDDVAAAEASIAGALNDGTSDEPDDDSGDYSQPGPVSGSDFQLTVNTRQGGGLSVLGPDFMRRHKAAHMAALAEHEAALAAASGTPAPPAAAQ